MLCFLDGLDGNVLIALTKAEVDELIADLTSFTPKVLGSRKRLGYLLNELTQCQMRRKGIIWPTKEE